jgi:hypothetical protein
MAYWFRKTNGRVYLYTTIGGKVKQVPKKAYDFLDAYSDDQVTQWVKAWEETHEGKKVNPSNVLYSDSRLNQIIDDFSEYRSTRGVDVKTVRYHKNLLKNYIAPYYLQQNPSLKDPRDWAASAPRLLNYLIETGGNRAR